MKRRDFITLLGGAAAAWPLAARAQQSAAAKRVGVLIDGAEPELRPLYTAFHDALTQLGWSEQHNVRIDYRWTDSNPDLALARARELIDAAPNVILAGTGPMAGVLQRFTHSIPIVFVVADDPVEAGYVQSYAHPGGNMTGFTQFEPTMSAKGVQLLKDVAPRMARVGVLRPMTVIATRRRRDLAYIEEASLAAKVTPFDLPFSDDAADIERIIADFTRQPDGGLIVTPSALANKLSGVIVALAERQRLPAVYFNRLFIEAGGLMSYGTDRPDVYRRAASYVDRILRGAKPDDLPVQAPTKYELVVNLKAAKTLGLAIPHEFLLIADEVIE
jgi:putative ABC transport system substrate-binding protein